MRQNTRFMSTLVCSRSRRVSIDCRGTGDSAQMSRIGSDVYVLAGMALAVSAALTLAMRKFALSRGLLDVPNERSSHKKPTARGGGAAIAATATTGFVILAALH